LKGVFLSLKKKGWLVKAGFELTISASSFRFTPHEETFFLRSATYTRNIKWQAVVNTGTAGSVIELKLVLTKLLPNIDIFINKSSYFVTKVINSLQKHNITGSEVSYIVVIDSV
jgi:hypothetical protein